MNLVCNSSREYYYFFPVAQQLCWDQDQLIVEVSGSRSDTQRSVRLPMDEWSAHRWDLYLTLKTHNRHTSMSHGVIRTRNPNKRAANGIGAVHYINEWSTITHEINYRQNIKKKQNPYLVFYVRIQQSA